MHSTNLTTTALGPTASSSGPASRIRDIPLALPRYQIARDFLICRRPRHARLDLCAPRHSLWPDVDSHFNEVKLISCAGQRESYLQFNQSFTI